MLSDTNTNSFHSLCGTLSALIIDTSTGGLSLIATVELTTNNSGFYNGTLVTVTPNVAEATLGEHTMRISW